MKKLILRWLGLTPNYQEDKLARHSVVSDNRNFIPEVRQRNIFEVIDAVNGKIVVFNRHSFNPNGPDVNQMEVYLVHEGGNLMETITTAMVSARLK